MCIPYCESQRVFHASWNLTGSASFISFSKWVASIHCTKWKPHTQFMYQKVYKEQIQVEGYHYLYTEFQLVIQCCMSESLDDWDVSILQFSVLAHDGYLHWWIWPIKPVTIVMSSPCVCIGVLGVKRCGSISALLCLSIL